MNHFPPKRKNIRAGSDLTGSDLPGSGLPGSDLTGSGLPGSGLPGSDLTESGLPRSDFPGSDLPGRDSLDIYAHRGSTILAPENTATAFDLALKYGADVLEIDVRLSRDGHVIVTHDATVDRTSDGYGNVAQLSLSYLKKLDAAYHFCDQSGTSYRDRHIRFITLVEMFELFSTTRINIDIKDNAPEAANAVAQAIHKAGNQTLVNVGSFHSSTLEQFRKQAPDVTTAATQSEVAQLYFGGKFTPPTRYQYLQIPVSYIGIPLTPAWFIEKARQLDIQTVYWTINDIGAMNKLVAKGVNGLVTDRIDLACQLRDSYKS